ncbi:MAG TPA: capsule assembly Wzi family protein [Gemmatimonadaceae bacterium]|nr:capsule assembly Wzi family protein [Gemmatimonadaceae bacterium]
MRPSQRLRYLVLATILFAPLKESLAQVETTPVRLRGPLTEGVVTVSGDSVDRLRLAELEGSVRAEGLMLRSTSSLTDPRRSEYAGRNFTLVFPLLHFVSNSELPFGQNDGALWAGKGANVRALAGFTASFGPVRLVAIPEFVYSSNNRLSIDPTNPALTKPVPASRSRFSSPFNVFPYSLDMPWRFGDQSINRIHGGQSSLTVTAGPIQVGAATENEWWGPAIRNAIVMSDNAPGFPHAFLRTSGPVNTILGRLDARLIVGGLHESDFFNDSTADDVRSLSAIALTWKQSASSGLTLGFTRSVYAPVDGYGDVAGSTFNAFRGVGHPNARAVSDSTMEPGPDQIVSLFARWALPRYGLESYVEWGRADFPISPRDLFAQPNHSRGFTAGFQWVRAMTPGVSRIRFQGELTNVEQSTTYRFRPIGSFYTSRAVLQGYTNEGQLIGAGLGPGSSGGWLAGDYFRGGWQFGLSLGRTRFNNDAFFLQRYAGRCGHDVSIYPGLRTSYANRYFRLGVEFAAVDRMNTFFQNNTSCDEGGAGTDRSNKNLSVTLATFGW